MARALRSGARRVLGNHGGARGKSFDAHYRALRARLGPFDGVTRDYASATAAAFVAYLDAEVAVTRATRLRDGGRGRRPSVQALERLRRRQGLSWGTFDGALRRLEELAASRPRPTLAHYLSSLRPSTASTAAPPTFSTEDSNAP